MAIVVAQAVWTEHNVTYGFPGMFSSFWRGFPSGAPFPHGHWSWMNSQRAEVCRAEVMSTQVELLVARPVAIEEAGTVEQSKWILPACQARLHYHGTCQNIETASSLRLHMCAAVSSASFVVLVLFGSLRACSSNVINTTRASSPMGWHILEKAGTDSRVPNVRRQHYWHQVV